jgi:hypothetical protein
MACDFWSVLIDEDQKNTTKYSGLGLRFALPLGVI